MARIFKDKFRETNITTGCQYDGHWLKRYYEDYTGINLDEERENSNEYKDCIEREAEILAAFIKHHKTLKELEDN